MFGALRRPVDQQNGRSRRNDIDDADQSLLRNARAPGARQRQQDGRQQGERQRIAVSRRALSGMTEHECDGRTKGCDLRQCQIDKNDFAHEHLDAEICVDTDETNRHQERRPKKCQRLNHLIAAAAIRASTFLSNSAM